MISYDVAVQTAPNASVGVLAGYGDWRIGVEILLPSEPQSLWGVAVWGQDNWTTLDWVDITPWVRGMEWTRGSSEFDGRADVGYATVTLDNTAGLFSVADPNSSLLGLVDINDEQEVINNYFGPGTVMRIVCISPTRYGLDWETLEHNAGAVTGEDAWVPMLTGVVESWPETLHHVGRENYVTVTFKETLSRLARVNTNALTSPVGDNDNPIERITRLGDSASWPFGYIDAWVDTYDNAPLQSTDMALNRLAEMYLTADSVGAVVRSDRSGAILLTGPITQTIRGPINNGVPTLYAGRNTPVLTAHDTSPIDPEGLTIDNDDAAIINHVSYARAGGTEQTASDAMSVGRFGMVTHSRNDLINKSDGITLDLAQQLVERRADLTKRVRSVELHNLIGAQAGMALISLDVGSTTVLKVEAADPDSYLQWDQARIDSMTHRVTPTYHGGPALWTCTLNFGHQIGPYFNDYPIGLRMTVDGHVRVTVDGHRRVTIT